MTDNEHDNKSPVERTFHMLSLGGDHVTVSGMTKHYVQLINEGIMVNPQHPKVEGMDLAHYLNVIVGSDEGIPQEDFQYILTSLFPNTDKSKEPTEEQDEEISFKDAVLIRNLVEGSGWSEHSARLKILGPSAGKAAVKATRAASTTRRSRHKSHYHPSKVPDNDSAYDPHWTAGDGLAFRSPEDEIHLAALRAASVIDMKRQREAQEALLAAPEEEKAEMPSLTQWTPDDAPILKQSFGMFGFYPEQPVEAKALKRMNGRIDRLMNGLSYFDDLAYRQGIATNAEKREALEEEAEALLDVLHDSKDGMDYARDIIHDIDSANFSERVSFGNAFPYEALLEDANLRARLSALAGFRQHQRLAAGEKTVTISEESQESSVELISGLIHESLGDLSAAATRKLAADFLKNEDKRFDHWYQVLGEASQHAYAHDVITDGLAQFDGQFEAAS